VSVNDLRDKVEMEWRMHPQPPLRSYNVQLLMSGPERCYYTICRCLTPETAAEIVRALLSAGEPPPEVRVEVVTH
jgi:galactose-1-phosphate uridylyltransferase